MARCAQSWWAWPMAMSLFAWYLTCMEVEVEVRDCRVRCGLLSRLVYRPKLWLRIARCAEVWSGRGAVGGFADGFWFVAGVAGGG